ncbi:hypothetical protein [uncultured Marinobacter sp.]|uniref:hypothetical protein n=1 Tax=uncultured Marinobacter sp. TaxID=187379 RepID=UPI00258C8E8A|nr:hypothetical protein [uncultured Marinobacter sp.]
MKRTTLFILAITFSTFAFAESDHFKMSYHGYNFYLPETPKASGFLGSENDTIVLKYGDDPGEGLVGFSVESEMATGGCEPEEFFKEVLGKTKKGCDRLAVESFQHVFVDDRDAGVWSGERHNFYYFIGDPEITVFFATSDSDSKILKVDTNFLTKKKLKKVFNEYLH